jgi:hypothetical protein
LLNVFFVVNLAAAQLSVLVYNEYFADNKKAMPQSDTAQGEES